MNCLFRLSSFIDNHLHLSVPEGSIGAVRPYTAVKMTYDTSLMLSLSPKLGMPS